MPEVVWIIRTLFSQGKSHRSAGSTGRLQEPLVSSRSRNLQRFGMEKVSRVESLQEIIAEMSDGEENPATTRSQPLLLPTHAATEIHRLKIEQDYPKRATSKENVAPGVHPGGVGVNPTVALQISPNG